MAWRRPAAHLSGDTQHRPDRTPQLRCRSGDRGDAGY